MNRFDKPKPPYQQYIEDHGPKALINDNDQFLTWILNESSLYDAVERCPGIVSELLEEYVNDWIKHVESTASNMGLLLHDYGNMVPEEDENDE